MSFEDVLKYYPDFAWLGILAKLVLGYKPHLFLKDILVHHVHLSLDWGLSLNIGL